MGSGAGGRAMTRICSGAWCCRRLGQSWPPRAPLCAPCHALKSSALMPRPPPMHAPCRPRNHNHTRRACPSWRMCSLRCGSGLAWPPGSSGGGCPWMRSCACVAWGVGVVRVCVCVHACVCVCVDVPARAQGACAALLHSSRPGGHPPLAFAAVHEAGRAPAPLWPLLRMHKGIDSHACLSTRTLRTVQPLQRTQAGRASQPA